MWGCFYSPTKKNFILNFSSIASISTQKLLISPIITSLRSRSSPFSKTPLQYGSLPASIAAKIGGVHDDVGFFGQRVALPDLHTAKAAIDGFAAASILLGKLRGRLFACAISCPKLVVLKALAAVKTFAASLAFISLLAILPAIFFDLL